MCNGVGGESRCGREACQANDIQDEKCQTKVDWMGRRRLSRGAAVGDQARRNIRPARGTEAAAVQGKASSHSESALSCTGYNSASMMLAVGGQPQTDRRRIGGRRGRM